jgi:hypothetical protein
MDFVMINEEIEGGASVTRRLHVYGCGMSTNNNQIQSVYLVYLAVALYSCAYLELWYEMYN